SKDKTVRVWVPATGKEWALLAGHTGDVFDVAFAPDGKLLASASDDSTVKLWQLSTRQAQPPVLQHKSPVHAVSFSSDGASLVPQTLFQTMKVWTVATGKERAPLKVAGGFRSLSASPDGRLLALTNPRGRVLVVEAATGKTVQDCRLPGAIHGVA